MHAGLAVDAAGAVGRILPELTPENEFFWTGGARGELLILRCGSCRSWIHPPQPVCPLCQSREVAPEAMSGRARLVSHTVNHQDWGSLAPPYVIALVELEEQPGLRLLTNLVAAAPAAIRSGMPLVVLFEHVEDVFLPLFAPAET